MTRYILHQTVTTGVLLYTHKQNKRQTERQINRHGQTNTQSHTHTHPNTVTPLSRTERLSIIINERFWYVQNNFRTESTYQFVHIHVLTYSVWYRGGGGGIRRIVVSSLYIMIMTVYLRVVKSSSNYLATSSVFFNTRVVLLRTKNQCLWFMPQRALRPKN